MDWVYDGGLVCLAVIVAVAIVIFAKSKELTPAQSAEIRRAAGLEETDKEG